MLLGRKMDLILACFLENFRVFARSLTCLHARCSFSGEVQPSNECILNR